MIINMNFKNKCCDTCVYYKWYYDLCTLFNCQTDARSICNCYKDLTKNKTYDIIKEKEVKE